MKIYLVAEDFDYGSGYDALGQIHKAFKSKQKAEELSNRMLNQYEWMDFDKRFGKFYVMEMDLDEDEE